MAVLAISALALVARLVQLQIVDHSKYAAEARLTHVSQESVNTRRGAILDRNGYPLAASISTYDVLVERRAWEDPDAALAAAQQLSPIVNRTEQELVEAVETSDIFEVAVARGLSFEQVVQVRELGLRGVRLLESSRRVYPEGSLAAQLIGFIGRDNVGLTGLEADLDDVLSGKKGALIFERDGMGRPIAVGERRRVAPQAGIDIILTIDRYIQRLVEKELDAAIEKTQASGGTIIAMDPKTGEVLAMASRPSFDLLNPDVSDNSKLDLFRNRAIADQYEPGSVFKLITMAAALDAGLVGPWTTWYDSGVVNVSDWSIYNWDFSANGTQSVTQILTKSLNTGAAWLSSLEGEERFYDYVYRFGFGQLTGIDLAAEVAGDVRTPENSPESWRPVDLATNSFGQGISVTPLQFTTALAAIANDGVLMRPLIVKELASSEGRRTFQPQPVGQAISPESARTLLDMMGVVVDGIPTYLLDVPGYKVGGKTGTASIATDDGTYKEGAYISSFAGVAPQDDPAIVILVKIDEPKGVPWGTVVAAPAFGHIAQAALAYLKIPFEEDALVSTQ
jgi:cell division protein FtsI/penicillin-binding protein 2